jgi:hypothetical protein
MKITRQHFDPTIPCTYGERGDGLSLLHIHTMGQVVDDILYLFFRCRDKREELLWGGARRYKDEMY